MEFQQIPQWEYKAPVGLYYDHYDDPTNSDLPPDVFDANEGVFTTTHSDDDISIQQHIEKGHENDKINEQENKQQNGHEQDTKNNNNDENYEKNQLFSRETLMIILKEQTKQNTAHEQRKQQAQRGLEFVIKCWEIEYARIERSMRAHHHNQSHNHNHNHNNQHDTMPGTDNDGEASRPRCSIQMHTQRRAHHDGDEMQQHVRALEVRFPAQFTCWIELAEPDDTEQQPFFVINTCAIGAWNERVDSGWFESKHMVYRTVQTYAMAVVCQLEEQHNWSAHTTSVERQSAVLMRLYDFLIWLTSYRRLFSDPCAWCKRRVAYEADITSALPSPQLYIMFPVLRTINASDCAYHPFCYMHYLASLRDV